MIFEEQLSRKPDHYPWAQEFIKAIHEGFWTDQLFSFSSDIQDFKTRMTNEERDIITKTMSAIGQVEVQVKKFWAKLGENLPHPSLYDLGFALANTEVIHGNAYERLLEVLDMNHVFEENMKLDIIKGRVNYLRKYAHRYYSESKKQYVYALILFTLFVENVSLFSQFYIINWLNKNKNILKDTNQQVKYTRHEEQLHALVGMKLINVIRKEHPELFDEELEERIAHEAEQAVIAESKIIDWILGDFNEKGLNAEILKEFIRSRINDSLKEIKFKKVFKIDKELIKETEWFEEGVMGNTSTDFFNSRPTSYAKTSQSFDPEDIV